MDYTEHYNKLIERARSRLLEGYSERHHIVPRCIGGTDDADNIVRLTAEEHYVAHQLLVNMHPSNVSLVYAAHMMGGTRTNNKSYGWLRRKFATSMSEAKRGVPQSEEHKRNAAAARTGNQNAAGAVRSKETRQKLRDVNIGKKHTEETKRKMSEKRKAYWAERRKQNIAV